MVPKKTIDMLASFLGGGMDISTFEQQVADRLYELRQTSRVTTEKELLAAIQLRLHEIGEGRDAFEVYIAAQSAMDTVAPQKVTAKTSVDDTQPRFFRVTFQPQNRKLEGEALTGTLKPRRRLVKV